MSIMRHIFCGILTVCLCIALAGCFQKTTDSQTSTPAATQNTERTEPTTETATEPMTVPSQEDTQPEETVLPVLPISHNDGDFVLVTDYIPDIAVELKYGTTDNFTGEVIYDFHDAYLRYGTVVKLMAVQEELREMGLSLKIWDGFRPVSAQWKLWQVYPDPNYVSHPKTGRRTHCRGNTVDVTLVDAEGRELEMPTLFDDFSHQADRNYSDCTEEAAANAILLQEVMKKYGFSGIQSEWWHFADDTDYPVEEDFTPINCAWWYADCEEFINLRCEPDVNAESIAQIPAGEVFRVLGWYDQFALAEYMGQAGYVNRDYISQCPE